MNKIKDFTLEECEHIVTSLLDQESIDMYNGNSFLFAACGLGFLTSSAIEIDDNDKLKTTESASEILKRIDFVKAKKAELNVSFYQAINLYFKENPPPKIKF